MNKKLLLITTIFFLAMLSTALAANNQSTSSTVYVLNSAPTVGQLTITPDPAEVGVSTMTIKANITDPNGIPGDFGTAVATYNDGTLDIISVNLVYNATSGLYENNTFKIPAQSNLGVWTVTINGTDSGGLFDTNSTTFTLEDTVSPIVSNLLPANDTNYPKDSSILISIVIADNGTIDTTLVTVIGPGSGLPTNVTLAYNSSSGKYEGTLSSIYTDAAGTYNMTTFVNDTGGNNGNVLIGYFTIGDIINPVINNVDATPDPVDPGETLNITANVTDNVAVDTVVVEVNGVNYTMSYYAGDIYYYDGLDTHLTAGLYYYTVYANDTTGNEATPVTGNFTVNTQVAITLTQVPIDFGNTTIPVTNRRADNGTAGSGYSGGTIKGFPALINNTGNVNITLSVNGTDMVGQSDGGHTVDVSNIKYYTENNVGGAAALTSGAAAQFKTNLTMLTTQDLFFWITLPEGLISQEYVGTVNIYAVQS